MQSLVATKVQESWLIWFLKGLLILGVLVLVARLIELQIIKGNYYRSLAEGNRIRRISVSAPRGRILARGGEVLVGNVEVKRKIEFDPETGYKKSDNLKDADSDEIISEWIRTYPLAADFTHVSGYLGEVDKDEVAKIDAQCPEKGPRKLGSWIGRGGLEEEYECRLRGIDGEVLIEVDTLGKKVRILGKKEPIPGKDLKTTIDFNLQKKVAEIIKEKNALATAGALIVTDGQGQILVLYSFPSFDPNLFVQREAHLDWAKLATSAQKIRAILEDSNLPLFNRAIAGAYHPGSVFKIVTATAALEDDKIDKDFLYEDPGVIKIKNFSYANWYFSQHGRTEGEIDLKKAIARSTDTFFYKLGEFVGIRRLADWAETFGLGKKTGIDLPGEVMGLVPTPEWKQELKGEPWFLGNTYHMAIGQGDITATPLQINVMTSIIASGGKFCGPYLFIGESRNSRCKDLGLKRETIDEVKKGMIGVCSEGGTAFPFFDFEPRVACKTGTAETEEEGKTHAWFTVFGPASPPGEPQDFPEIVMTVLVEKGGEGSYVAAPIAREIFDYYFNR